jgi:catechol 2,3-dioxygenase-like lactoylglutathione lyase family enzyme
MTPQIDSLDHLVLTVAEPDASVRFYTRILGMRAESFAAADGTTRTALVFGRQKINLHQAGAEFAPHAAAPCPGSADLCFLSDVPLAEWPARRGRFSRSIAATRTGTSSRYPMPCPRPRGDAGLAAPQKDRAAVNHREGWRRTPRSATRFPAAA